MNKCVQILLAGLSTRKATPQEITRAETYKSAIINNKGNTVGKYSSYAVIDVRGEVK